MMIAAPTDLPPPPPSADPREPSPTTTRGRTIRTPQRPRSPMASRGASPTRMSSPTPTGQHSPSPGDVTHDHPPIGLAQPVPRPLGTSPPPIAYTGHGSSPPGMTGSGSPSVNPISSPQHHQQHHHHHHHHAHHVPPYRSRPSSPSASSIHSSTSAIFERDIELPAVASLSLNPNQTQTHTLSHKSSRLSHLSQASALDHSVPAVLQDAVEALHTEENESPANGIQGLEIEAPVPIAAINMARQSSTSIPRKASTQSGVAALHHSRSPSPVSMHSGASGAASPTRSPPILAQLATQHSSGSMMGHLDGGVSPTSGGSGVSAAGVGRPGLSTRISSGPEGPSGGSNGGHDGEGTDPSSPPARPEELTSAAAAAAATAKADDLGSFTPTPPVGHSVSSFLPHNHLGNTANKDKRRISYISYNDLLLSVPTTVTPLADITSGNLSPDHLPGTISPSVSALSPGLGASVSGGIAGAATVSPSQTPTPGTGNLGTLGSSTGSIHTGVHETGVLGESRMSGSWDAGTPGSRMGLGLGDGEWGRQGLGGGLEQRLEGYASEESKV
ncbi:hypothetical protein BD324DRAFT_653526 [Kockovaella imperatae]|uniref:Uncharacterized protein n=1 Tax=Kockovaella imperatae TaxID=4999 RepID=A0A1Y1U8C0_9TREE|nr:hypothetical protein BD324DRAFT_653526 [Kockovaella imperatae]ORX34258.1 hypothetical protein BD324DRAFT_653526 [Kockovaella imperatae]